MPTDTIFNLSKNSIKPDNKQDCIKLALVSWHLKKKWHFQEPNDSISWFRGSSWVCWRFSEYLSKRISNGLMGQMSQMSESIILGPRSKPNPLNFFLCWHHFEEVCCPQPECRLKLCSRFSNMFNMCQQHIEPPRVW